MVECRSLNSQVVAGGRRWSQLVVGGPKRGHFASVVATSFKLSNVDASGRRRGRSQSSNSQVVAGVAGGRRLSPVVPSDVIWLQSSQLASGRRTWMQVVAGVWRSQAVAGGRTRWHVMPRRFMWQQAITGCRMWYQEVTSSRRMQQMVESAVRWSQVVSGGFTRSHVISFCFSLSQAS